MAASSALQQALRIERHPEGLPPTEDRRARRLVIPILRPFVRIGAPSAPCRILIRPGALR